LSGNPSQSYGPPRTGRPGAVCCRAGSVRRTSPVEETRDARASHAGPVGEVASGGEAVSASEVESGATTTAGNVTRGRPTARSRTGRPCASRTAGRSCRPDSRAARRPGVAGRRSEARTGTAVASDSWADARSRRSRREGEYGPAPGPPPPDRPEWAAEGQREAGSEPGGQRHTRGASTTSPAMWEQRSYGRGKGSRAAGGRSRAGDRGRVWSVEDTHRDGVTPTHGSRRLVERRLAAVATLPTGPQVGRPHCPSAAQQPPGPSQS
jgi:hypothetical protein